MITGAARQAGRLPQHAGRVQGEPDGDVVDRAHLTHHTMGDIRLACEVLGLFRMQVDNYVDQLRAAADEKAWHEAAHALKGSARCIGAGGLAGAAKEAEDLGFRPGGAAHDQAVAAVATAVVAVKAFIDDYVRHAQAA